MKFLSRLLINSLVFLVMSACQPFDHTGDTSAEGSLKPGSELTVNGQLKYQDRLYNNAGFVNSLDSYKAIRNVRVELRDTDDQLIAESLSDANGAFAFNPVAAGNYVLRVIAQSDHVSGTRVAVKSATGQLYAIEQAVSLSSENSDIEFNATIEDRVAGIFNLLDTMTLALDFVDTLALNLPVVNDLNIFWQWGYFNNTFTCRVASTICSSGAGIYVLSDPHASRDTDEFDDDVLWHEFAHHLEASWRMWDSPGGAHSLISRSLDLRLSWSEGMASAFSASLKKWLRSTAPERLSTVQDIGQDLTNYYIDTLAGGTQISLDLYSASSAYYRYATNEVAVASGILRLQAQTDIQTVWQRLFNGLTINTTADTMEAFWDSMVGGLLPNATVLSQWQSSLSSKLIHYQLDEAESNGAANSATPLAINDVQNHTLYRNHYAVDEDWFLLSLASGQTYRIETFDLTNGADTDLRLYDADLNLLLSNDDADECSPCSPLHDGQHFSSMLEYTPTETSNFYVRIRTADAVFLDSNAYGYIGRYGGYRIQVIEAPLSQ